MDVNERKFEKIIEKIKNLMDLASNNPNQNEAMAAALKAQELMAKYNVHMTNLGNGIEKEKIGEKRFRGSQVSGNKSWRNILAKIIAGNFRCKVYICLDDYVFYGYENDAEIALQTFTMLVNVATKLSRQEYYNRRKNGMSTKGVMNAFLIGFCEGVREVLDKQCTALLIVTPKEVEDKFKEKTSGWEKYSRRITYNSNEDVKNHGRIAGRNAMGQRNIAMA